MRKKISIKLVMASLVFYGCGPARPLVSPNPPPSAQPEAKSNAIPSPNPAPDPAVSLNLRILSEGSPFQIGRHFRTPDPNFDADILSSLDLTAKREGNQISYSQIIQLPHPNSPDPDLRKEIFFSWPDQFLGSEILHASVSHQILKGNNEKVGVLEFQAAHHNPSRHFWSLNILRLFRNVGDEYGPNVNEADTQVITLELTLASASKVVIEIRFRVSGPKP